MKDLKPCPACNSNEVLDKYVYIQCGHCGMTGPQMNDGRNDDHADNTDHEHAVRAWNDLPRRK